MDNREYIFRVLNDVTKLPFLAEAMLILRYSYSWGVRTT